MAEAPSPDSPWEQEGSRQCHYLDTWSNEYREVM